MTDDLFSAGFAWSDDADLSQPTATLAATPPAPDGPSFYGDFLSDPWPIAGAVAPVAPVAPIAETEGQRLERALSQPLSPMIATPVATAETADFRASQADAPSPIADVASVAGWAAGVATLNDRRVPPGLSREDWSALVRDARHLMALWGHDLHALGWSACDVFGVERIMTHRRLDRLGLVSFVSGGVVEAVDSDTASLVYGKDRLTFYRQLRSEGSVPLWAVSMEEDA